MMSQAEEQRIHSIQTVARRTGLSPDVIRVWERRYGAVDPARSPTRRRQYSDEDLQRLLLLRRATLAGRRISEVAQLPLNDLVALVKEDAAALANVPQAPASRPATGGSELFEACVAAVRQLDAEGLETALRRAARELSTNALLDEVLVPLMVSVGEDWENGALRISHEHLTTSLVRSLLDALRASQARTLGGPAIVVSTPQGQVHELGAMMAALIAAAEGWQVTYLGPNVPAEELGATVSRTRAAAVALSVIYPEHDPQCTAELKKLRELLPEDVAILVGGQSSAGYAADLADLDVKFTETLRDYEEALSRHDPRR